MAGSGCAWGAEPPRFLEAFGRLWQVQSRLGSGSSASVYRVRCCGTPGSPPGALKQFLPPGSTGAAASAAEYGFRKERAALEQLQGHRNIGERRRPPPGPARPPPGAAGGARPSRGRLSAGPGPRARSSGLSGAAALGARGTRGRQQGARCRRVAGSRVHLFEPWHAREKGEGFVSRTGDVNARQSRRCYATCFSGFGGNDSGLPRALIQGG